MVKLFIGNLPREATEQEIRSLFEQYGKVLECDIIKNYGFVHIEDKTAAEDAIRNLHHYKLHGVNINVEASKNKSKASTKLHVGNISPTCTNQELRAKFEEYGPVIECDIVKDYAFVHMERAEDAVEAIRGLDNTEFQGKRMHVQLSTSRLRTAPGMGDQSGCYRCGKEGHWSKECPVDRSGRVADFTEQYNEQYGAVRTPYTMGYGESVYYNDAYGALDYYKRYRVRSYEAVAAAAAASAYNYAEQTMSHLPQVQNTAVTSHLNSTSVDPYDRHLLPNSGAAATSAAMAAGLLPLPPLPPITEGTGAPCVVVQLYSPRSERATVMGQRASCLRLQQLHGILCMTWPGMNGSSMWTEHGTQPFKNWR
nr:PREDICTED: RNA-binding protein 4B isoform X1 [Bos mutus]